MNHRSFNPPLPKSKYTHIGSLLRHLLTSTETRKMANPSGPPSPPIYESYVSSCQSRVSFCPYPQGPTSAPVGQSLKRPPVPLWVYVEGPPQPQNGPFRGGGQKFFLKGRGLWGKVHVNVRALFSVYDSIRVKRRQEHCALDVHRRRIVVALFGGHRGGGFGR